MKFNLLKVIVAFAIVLSLLFVGVASIDPVSGITARHDGWTNDEYVY